MIRILHIGAGSKPGGIENCLMNYYRYINRREFSFDFCDIYGEGLAYEKEIKSLGGSIYPFPHYKRHPVLFYRQFRDFLRENEYDFIHIHLLSGAGMLPVIAVRRTQTKKMIVHCHNSGMPKGGLRRFLHVCSLPYLRGRVRHQWSCGQKAGDWMWGSKFRKENIIYNGIDIAKYHPDEVLRQQIRKEYHILPEEILLGFVGRLEEQKNPLFLLEILKHLKKTSQTYKLVIVGDGSKRAAMEEKVKEYSLENQVIFTGYVEDSSPWYQAMDVFILPSLFEGLPVVAIEAQGAGLPCILSDAITNEVDVSGLVRFLPISNPAKDWAMEIQKTKERELFSFQREYDILYGVGFLEEKYKKLLRQDYKDE